MAVDLHVVVVFKEPACGAAAMLEKFGKPEHKYSSGSVRPVVSQENEAPRCSCTPGSFLVIRVRRPQQFYPFGVGGNRSVMSFSLQRIDGHLFSFKWFFSE